MIMETIISSNCIDFGTIIQIFGLMMFSFFIGYLKGFKDK